MPRIYFGDIVSPVVKVNFIILILSISVAFYFEVEPMDMKETFLHWYLEEKINMRQPEGFAMKGNKEPVCRLKKSMYWLK